MAMVSATDQQIVSICALLATGSGSSTAPQFFCSSYAPLDEFGQGQIARLITDCSVVASRVVELTTMVKFIFAHLKRIIVDRSTSPKFWRRKSKPA